jgi:hypothetical protein
MENLANGPKQLPASGFAIAAAIGAAVVLGGFWLAPQAANATSAYASQTGLACGRCHVSAGGGGPRTAFGKAFAANGHKVPAAKGKPQSGTKSSQGGAGSTVTTVTTETVVATPSCGYYSLVCNPRYGSVPEFGYSDALTFKLYPQGN